MRVAFYHSTKSWCIEFAQMFGEGVRRHGDYITYHGLAAPIDEAADVLCLLGAGFHDTYTRVSQSGKQVVYIDKGYTRAKDFTAAGAYFHMSVNSYRPNKYIGKWKKPSDRRMMFEWIPTAWHKLDPDRHILLAWSSVKYHQFHNLAAPHEYAGIVVKRIREFSKRPIVYRQKPNQIRIPVEGTITSEGRPIEHDLASAHCLVTVGSSSCLQAMLMGVPSICLGDAIMEPISNNSLEYIPHPYRAMEYQRLAILNDLAYCQWHQDEYVRGTAWANTRPLLVKEAAHAGL